MCGRLFYKVTAELKEGECLSVDRVTLQRDKRGKSYQKPHFKVRVVKSQRECPCDLNSVKTEVKTKCKQQKNVYDKNIYM